jgi:hypothetical protein
MATNIIKAKKNNNKINNKENKENKENNGEYDDIIKNLKEIFRMNRDLNNKYSAYYSDKKIRDDIVNWLKKEMYKDDETKKIVPEYIKIKKLLDNSSVDLYLSNELLHYTLCEEVIDDFSQCNDKNIIVFTFGKALNHGYIPNIDNIHSIMITKDYTNELLNSNIINVFKDDVKYKNYKNKIMRILFTNFNGDIYDKFYENEKYDQKTLDFIFTKNPNFINHVLDRYHITNQVKLDEKHFEILMFYNIYSPIANLIKNNIFSNLDKCFELFLKKIKDCYVVDYNHSGQNFVLRKLVVHMVTTYEQFCEKIIFSREIYDEHYNLFFSKYQLSFEIYEKFTSFLITKNIFPTKNNIKAFLKNVKYDLCFDNFFNDLIFTEDDLNNACLYKRANIVKLILDQKILPTKRCLDSLLEINLDREKEKDKDEEHKNIKSIVDNFMHYSYYFTNSDIIALAKRKIMLQKSVFTLNLTFSDEEKKQLYQYCDFEFMPNYNDSMFNDKNWLIQMCKVAKKSDDYKIIKNYIKKQNIEVDFYCYMLLTNNGNSCRMKDEVLSLYKHGTNFYNNDVNNDNEYNGFNEYAYYNY